jgi:hypothetical protein
MEFSTMYNNQPSVQWQSDDYQQARSNFYKACSGHNVDVVSHKHPLLGPSGESLTCDVALFGPENAEILLVMVSGVHGVEGFSGSATQVGWIEDKQYESLPENTAVLMIHQINPWGSAHLRRYNEDNVDLCRNFLDFSKPLSKNNGYLSIHHELVLGKQLGEEGELSGPYLGKKVSELGIDAVIDLFMGGQHELENGFSFGGTQEVWSNTLLRSILSSHNQFAKKVCVIEYHTGLGPWAYGTLITMHDGDELERVRDWFGRWSFNPACDKNPDEDGYRIVQGHTIEAYKASFPNAEVTAVTLEFGSYPENETLALLVQEHLLVQQESSVSDHIFREVKNKLLEYHHPKDWEWRCSFWERSMQVIRQALAGLSHTN